MQPFDDLVPAEMDPQNAEMLAFLRQSHGISELSAAEPDPQQKALALAAVRQRLLEMRQAQLFEGSAQSPAGHGPSPADLTQAPVPHVGSRAKGTRRRQWERGLALLAAVFCVFLLVGSMLAVFGLSKRGPQGQKPSIQVSTQTVPHSLYIATSGHLQKIDASTGMLIWQAQLPHRSADDSPLDFPLVGNGTVYV
nr:hypothetical protein [Chloroflexota bacterium]